MECLVFSRQCSWGHGFTQTEAMNFTWQIHDAHALWLGCWVQMWCVPRSLWDTKGDLKVVKDYIQECTYGKNDTLSPSRQPGESCDPCRQAISHWDTIRGREMVQHSDHYFSDQYLKKEARDKKASTWTDTSGMYDPTAWHQHHAQVPDAPVELGAGTSWSGGGIGCLYPLDCGWPEDVPQAFHDAFHSACGRIWLDEFPLHHCDRRERRDQCLAYQRRHRERWQGQNGQWKKLNLLIFRDSTSDNVITYDDWGSKVNNYVWEVHTNHLIHDSVLSALEGHPHQ